MSGYSRRQKAIALALSASLLIDSSSVVIAMQAMDDSELSEENGAGLAFPFENFRFEMEKTSFIQLTGSDTNLCTFPSTTSPAGCTTFRRGDIRYYGLTMSRGTTGGLAGTVTTTNVTDWFGNGCTAGTYGLGCPISTQSIINYANYDNPFILRVFNYDGYDTGGTLTNSRPVLELLGPSNMDPFRWSFFGEIEAGRTVGATASNGMYPITGATCTAGSGTACLLQLQNIILGKPAARLKPPSIGGSSDATNPYYGPALRMFQYAGTTAANGVDPATYGIQYESRLSGNYRMSVNTTGGAVARGTVPDFTDEEGLYLMNVQAFLPLGQMHYQALVFDDTQPGSSGSVTTNGNVAITVSRIPNITNVYRDFYSFADGTAGSVNSGYTRTGRPDRYYQTHGYVEWGTAFSDNGGVSQVRFSGVDPDGPTTTTASYMNCGSASGYPGVSGTFNGTGGACTRNDGQAVGNVVGGSTTRDNVIAAGGMVFVSKNGTTTWTVVNNQNLAVNNTLNMLYVCEPGSAGQCGSPNSTGVAWDNQYRMERDARYGSYNPQVSVNAINLGTARVNGLLIHHMKIQTLGGQ